MSGDCLKWIRDGDVSLPFVKMALDEVRKRYYPVSDLRTALMSGLRIKIAEYKDRIEQGDTGWQGVMAESEKMLHGLEEGEEVIYKGIIIPE